MNEKLEETICRAPRPAGEVANTLKRTSWKEVTKTPLLVNRVRQRAKGKITKGK